MGPESARCASYGGCGGRTSPGISGAGGSACRRRSAAVHRRGAARGLSRPPRLDGRGAPMIGQAEHERRWQPHTAQTAGATTRTRRRRRRKERPRVRRTTGKKSKNAKVAIVGGIYTLQPTPEGVEGDRSTRGSTRRSRATGRSSSGCAARQTNAATARSGRSFWAMAASTSGDSSRRILPSG